MSLKRLVRFKKNKIYILPTGHGVVFLLGIFVMILSAATYGNNLIYILAFTLFSICMGAMVQTHNNLRGIDLHLIHFEESFAEKWTHVDVRLSHRLKVLRQSIEVRLIKSDHFESKWGSIDLLSPRSSASVEVPVLAQRRGIFDLPDFVVETKYPMGLFRAWKHINVGEKVYVYPSLKGSPYLPRRSGYSEEGEKLQATPIISQEMDFKEHRPHREGESHRHIDWKLVARRGEYLVKTFEGERDQAFRFDYSHIPKSTNEDRLSQLAVWVYEAFKTDAGFELILPKKKIELGSGVTHYKLSLRELASFKEIDTQGAV